MTKKRVLSLALTVLLLASMLCGCQEETLSATAKYKVTVIGVDGNPMTSGVVVKFMQNGVQKAMQTVDAGGTAVKELPRGDYQVELQFTRQDLNLDYDRQGLTLSATKTEAQVELFNFLSGDVRYVNVKTSNVWPFTLVLNQYGAISYISADRITAAEDLQRQVAEALAYEYPKDEDGNPVIPKWKDGNQVNTLCYGHDLQVINGSGVTAETVNPAKTGKATLICFWGVWSGHSLESLESINQLAAENPNLNVIAIHSFQDAEKAPAYIQEHYADSNMIFAQDYAEEGYHAMLGGAGENIKLFTAYHVAAGKTKVELDAGSRTYFVFAPTEPGVYELSFTGSITAIGSYGTPNYANDQNVAAPVEGNPYAFTIEVTAGMIGTGGTGTAEYVIGVNGAEGTTAGVLNIIRKGDAEEEMPYTVYQRTYDLKAYKHPSNAQVVDFDLTQTYTLVLNPTDHYYHLNTADGPLVLVHLGVNAKYDDADSAQGYRYLPSIHTVLKSQRFVRWYYDEEGKVEKKLGFNNCLLEYLANEATVNGQSETYQYHYVDNATGLYPLTEDLKFILTETGEHRGWWEMSSENYLFYDAMGNKVPVEKETAWLFGCCYIAE